MSRALVEAVAARIETVVSTNRTVYRHAVPDAPPVNYLMVRSNVGTNESFDLADTQSLRNAVVWVTSVSRNPNAVQGAAEAMWGMEKAHAALTGWRPTIGTGGAWKPVHLTSQPVERDNDLPDPVMYAVATYGFTYQV